MVLGTDKKKLSKRHGAVSVEEFRDRGSAVPQALVNYLALVGWSFDDHTTMMTVPELVERFSLERVNSSPGVFDPEKLEWLNGEHLRALLPAEFAAVAPALPRGRRLGTREAAGAGRRGGADRPGEAPHARPVRGVRRIPVRPGRGRPGRVGAGRGRCGRPAVARRGPRGARRRRAWEGEAIHSALAAACEKEGVKPRVLYTPVRVALTGKTVAPGLYESLELLGRDESLARIDAALARLSA